MWCYNLQWLGHVGRDFSDLGEEGIALGKGHVWESGVIPGSAPSFECTLAHSHGKPQSRVQFFGTELSVDFVAVLREASRGLLVSDVFA